MTAQTPAPKASSAQALLASLPTNPPRSPAFPQQDFLTVISLALAAKTDDADSPPAVASSAPAPAQEKPAPADAADAAVCSFLLALLTPLPPQPPVLAKPPAQKALIPSVPSPSRPSQAANAPDSKAISLAKSWAAADSKSAAPAVKPLPAQVDAVAAGTEANHEPLVKPDTPAAPEKPGCPPASPDGTSVAISGQRMNFTAQRNESAGPAEQKLPPGGVSAVKAIAGGGGASSQGGAKPSLHFSWQDAPSEELAVIDLSAKATGPALSAANATGAALASTAASGQVDRLEQLISREVVSIRQTGIETLGVLLKVDSSTELFLQLTNHNGQVQASLRCERGDFSALDPQWAQLQQSLARQNVQLVPPAASSSPSGFQPPPDQSQRQPAPAREDWPSAGPVVLPAQQRQQKNQNRSRRSWESWA